MKVVNTEKKKKYTLITFENNKTFAVDPSLVKKYNICENEDADMFALLDENEDFSYTYGLDYAFRILGISAKTHSEMRSKLFDKFVQTNAVNRIMDRLTELKYINDKVYCEDYVSYKKDSGMSKRAIRNNLLKKGVNEDLINDALEAYCDEEELEHAENLASKIADKYDSLDYEKLRNKLYSRLSSKGFSTRAIYHATDKLKERYNSSYSDRDTIMRTAARMNMRGLNRDGIYQALIKKSNSKDYEVLINDILNELFDY